MKLISTKNKLVLKDFRHVFTGEKNKSIRSLNLLTHFIADKITLNVVHIRNLDFINIFLKWEPISKFYLPVLDTEWHISCV